jgi:multidrug efflux system membrane fusion protein
MRSGFMMRHKRIAGVGLAVLGAGIALLGAQGGPPQAAAQSTTSSTANSAVPVTVIKVQRKDLPEYARGIGTVQAYRSVLVRSRVDGTLENIAFREGQEVKAGDLLAEIDPRPYAAILAQARAKRASDVAQLDNAKHDLARYAKLARSNYASQQQLETQQALVEQDTANIQGDDANIDSAALNLSFCRITAPIGGVVGLRLVDIGNLIHATDTAGIVSLTQVHPIAVVFTLPQEQLPALRESMQRQQAKNGSQTQGFDQRVPLPVTAVTSEDNKPLSQGHLLTPNNSIDTTTGTISLKAEFANNDNKLWPGQFVAAKLQLAIAQGALTLPPSAVQHGPDGLFVFVVKPDNTVARQVVQVGYEDEAAAVITDGLKDGEEIVLSGQLRLQAGTKIDPRTQDSMAKS